MKSHFIKGENIYLRPFEENDIDRWYKWFNDKEVTYYMDQRRFPNTPEKQVEFLRKMNKSESDIQLAIVIKKNDELIGTIGLHQIDFINGNTDVSIVIGEKKYWNKKFGKEAAYLLIKHAFDFLNLHKLTAGMVEDNKASYNLFISLGFKREGILRQQIYIHGKYKNVIKLGLLKHEYVAK